MAFASKTFKLVSRLSLHKRWCHSKVKLKYGDVNKVASTDDDNPTGAFRDEANNNNNTREDPTAAFKILPPELDLEYLCDPKNTSELTANVNIRKGVGNAERLVLLAEKIKAMETHNHHTAQNVELQALKNELVGEAQKMPNKTHPEVRKYGETSKVLETVNLKPEFNFKPRELHEITDTLGVMRTANLGNLTGSRSYYLIAALARLEQALIKYTVTYLLQRGFTLVSVPDLLHPKVIQACGMQTTGERTQVYALEPEYYGQICLAGTSEMALAALFANQILPFETLPQKLVAVSRCYRAELSSTLEEKGIYRVHQFTKVEMFGLTGDENNGVESQDLLDEFVALQQQLFSKLGLHFQVLDMAPYELGAPAYRKIDTEAWMPGRKMFGEVSSASNCTDYQSRRLHIRYQRPTGILRHVHTVNGTACAVPRMIIALAETHQQVDGSITIPTVLRPFMDGLESISGLQTADMQWIKFKSQTRK